VPSIRLRLTVLYGEVSSGQYVSDSYNPENGLLNCLFLQEFISKGDVNKANSKCTLSFRIELFAKKFQCEFIINGLSGTFVFYASETGQVCLV
jgi:hypothetical protein